jgi:hypothetical protein
MSGPEVWGPHGWKFIHYITLGYPYNPTNEIKNRYLNFFNSLKFVIPCSICGANFIKHMEEYPLTDKILSNKMEFINWGILMHNLVNLSNNKKVYSNSEGFEEIKKNCIGDCPGKILNYNDNFIDSFTNIFSNNNSNNKYIYILIGIIVMLIIYIMITKIYKNI